MNLMGRASSLSLTETTEILKTGREKPFLLTEREIKVYYVNIYAGLLPPRKHFCSVFAAP